MLPFGLPEERLFVLPPREIPFCLQQEYSSLLCIRNNCPANLAIKILTGINVTPAFNTFLQRVLFFRHYDTDKKKYFVNCVT
jgi:hypothetical protein